MSTTERHREVYHIKRGTVQHKAKLLLKAATARARRDNRFIDLTVESIIDMWPEDGKCPILGIPLRLDNPATSDDSPSIDRVDSTKGYTEDNCCVISHKANRIKNNGTIEELRAILYFMENICG